MLHRISTVLSIVAICATLASCGKSDSEPAPAPGLFLLSQPANNSACIKNDKPEVELKWAKSANADSYEIEVKDLKTQKATTYTAKETSCKVALEPNKPYSWCVKAINVTGKTTSETWFFYLAGQIAEKYVPFPAELQTPINGTAISSDGATSIEVSFSWKGNDLDNDIVSYSFYLDNKDASTQVVKSLTESSTKQKLDSGKTYFWKVVTKDAAGNTSVSTVGSFRII